MDSDGPAVLRLAAGRLGATGRALLPVLLVLLGAATLVQAETPVKPDGEPVPVEELRVPGTGGGRGRIGGTGSAPGLDDLLRLPSDFEAKPVERPVAGASEDEWRRRFARAEKSIVDAREKLTATKRELDGMAETGGANQWSVAPPGASAQQSTSPLSFKLRQELQRNREALEAAERALRELRIEADLAGVPAEWRVVSSEPPAPAPVP